MSEVPPVIERDYATVVWRLLEAHADGTDEDFLPDWKALTDKNLTIRPSLRGFVVHDPEGSKTTLKIADVKVQFNGQGELQTIDGLPVRLHATDDPKLSVQGWYWYFDEYPTIQFATPRGTTVNVADYISLPPTEEVKEWLNKIPELIELVNDLIGIISITQDGTDILVTTSDLVVHRFPIPGTTWDQVSNKPGTFAPALPLPATVENPSALAVSNEASVTVSPDGLFVDRLDGNNARIEHGSATFVNGYDPTQYTSLRRDGIYMGTPEGLRFVKWPDVPGGQSYELATLEGLNGISGKTPWKNFYFEPEMTEVVDGYWYTLEAMHSKVLLQRDGNLVHFVIDLSFQGAFNSAPMRELTVILGSLPVGYRPTGDTATDNGDPYGMVDNEVPYQIAGRGMTGEFGELGTDDLVFVVKDASDPLWVYAPRSTSDYVNDYQNGYHTRIRGSGSFVTADAFPTV